MNDYKSVIAILIIAIFLLTAGLIYGGWQIKVLQNDLDDTAYQLTLSSNETAHIYEAYEDLFKEYERAKDTAGFWAGQYMKSNQLYLDYLNKPPEVITEYIEIEVPVEKEVTVYKPLEHWQTIDELELFLEGDDTNQRVFLFADSNGDVYITDYCEDLAYQLTKRAELIGKRLDTEILTRHECLLYRQHTTAAPYLMQDYEQHMIVKAVIGDNEVWFIEPANDNIWLAGYLD